jgi:purine-cytosine permease-like protein
MFSRWYALFLGYLLIVSGIAGLIAAGSLPGSNSGLITASIIWLIIAVVSLWVGYGLRNDNTVRWYAGILGGLLFIWGVIQLFSAPAANTVSGIASTASVGGLLVLLGSLGLAAATLPAAYRERRVEGMGMAA